MLLVALAAIGTVSAADVSTDHTITASGTGSVMGTPDRAQISLAVETENPDVRVAQAENAAMMTKVMDALIAAGIPKDALKTTGYNIYPVYDDSKLSLTPKVKTYQVTNTLTVTLHDVSRTGEVIDIGIANGINQANSIRFFLSDEQNQVLRTEALKEVDGQGGRRCSDGRRCTWCQHLLGEVSRYRRRVLPGDLPELCGEREGSGRSVDPDRSRRHHGDGDGHGDLPDRVTPSSIFTGFFIRFIRG